MYKVVLTGGIIHFSAHRRKEREAKVLTLEKGLPDASELFKHSPTIVNRAVLEKACTTLDLALTDVAESKMQWSRTNSMPRGINHIPRSHVNSCCCQTHPPIKLKTRTHHGTSNPLKIFKEFKLQLSRLYKSSLSCGSRPD